MDRFECQLLRLVSSEICDEIRTMAVQESVHLLLQYN